MKNISTERVAAGAESPAWKGGRDPGPEAGEGRL